MPRAIIFANGRMDTQPAIIVEILPSDLIIAADGGAHHCKSLGITPNVLIGDLDSVKPEEVTRYKQAGVEILKFPTHKNETDLELALQYTVNHGFTQVFLIGALGARWDMSIANILLAAQPSYSALNIHLLDGTSDLTLLRGGNRIDLNGKSGDPISLIPIAGDATGITTHGLDYELTDETLFFGSPRGVSNVFSGDHAEVNLREGLLLICRE